MSEVTKICELCNKPLAAQADDEAPAWVVSRFLAITVHQHCHEDRWRLADDAKRAEAKIARQTQWEGICPYEFRKPIDPAKCDTGNLDRLIETWAAASEGGKGVLIHGLTGRCKTRFAFQVLQAEYLAGKTVAYYYAPDLRVEFNYLMTHQSQSQSIKWVKWLSDVNILFIDDLGKAALTESFLEMLYILIDARCRHNRPLFITTNETLESLTSRILEGLKLRSRNPTDDCAEPILRRIKEHCEPIHFR